MSIISVLSKVTLLFCIALVELNSSATAQERYAQYPRIDAYEVRPGILMMPRYTDANEVCELGLERLQYSPKLIRLNADLFREEIFQTLDDLVPLNERGKLVKDNDNLIEQFGQSPTMTMRTEYENLKIIIYAIPLLPEKKNRRTMNPLVATVKWKHRQCRKL